MPLSRFTSRVLAGPALLQFAYHHIRTDALRNGLIQSANNRLSDVAGQNPYQFNSAFAVAAFDAVLPSATTACIFHSDLFWTNTGRTVAALQADFAYGNGFGAMSGNAARTVILVAK